MRVTYRQAINKDYWEKRWTDIPADLPMEDASIYPLKYAEMAVRGTEDRILEAGCGAGRILRYYHERGYTVFGFDFIDVAIQKLRVADPSLMIEVADVRQLHFDDESFDCVLAFGLYHNLEDGLDLAVAETFRVLAPAGRVCASFRADNVQTRLTDGLAKRRQRKSNPAAGLQAFHKMNLTKNEFRQLFTDVGFDIATIYPVENMPILYKFRPFRSRSHREFDENRARAEGYQLSLVGQALQNFLMRFFEWQFCNVYVLIATKA